MKTGMKREVADSLNRMKNPDSLGKGINSLFGPANR
jgi:hypothetical protein